MEQIDQQRAIALLGDPSTPAEVLAQIAGQHRDSWPLVARHPNVYPGLLDWMRQQGLVAEPRPPTMPAALVPVAPASASPAGAQGYGAASGSPMAAPGSAYQAMPTERSRRKRTGLIVGLIVAAVLLAGGATAVVTMNGPGGALATWGRPAPMPSPTPTRDRPTASPSQVTTSTRTSQPTATTTALLDPEAEALRSLGEQAARDGARITKQGQWVAQLASKYVGVTDPRQVTANGSHTFMAADIWAEYEELKRRGVSLGKEVVLLDSRTYGKRHHRNGEALWVVAAVSPSFTDEASVKSFCAGMYPNLSGKDLTNSCMPNRLNP